MFYNIEDEKVSLRIKAQPAASKNELVKFLAKSFKVSKSDILFKSGQQSKIKIIEFPLTEKFNDWIEEYGYR